MKIALSADLSKNRQLNYVPYIYHGDTEHQILDKVFSANVKTFHDKDYDNAVERARNTHELLENIRY